MPLGLEPGLQGDGGGDGVHPFPPSPRAGPSLAKEALGLSSAQALVPELHHQPGCCRCLGGESPSIDGRLALRAPEGPGKTDDDDRGPAAVSFVADPLPQAPGVPSREGGDGKGHGATGVDGGQAHSLATVIEAESYRQRRRGHVVGVAGLVTWGRTTTSILLLKRGRKGIREKGKASETSTP